MYAYIEPLLECVQQQVLGFIIMGSPTGAFLVEKIKLFAEKKKYVELLNELELEKKQKQQNYAAAIRPTELAKKKDTIRYCG
jgi:hypothetical protein